MTSKSKSIRVVLVLVIILAVPAAYVAFKRNRVVLPPINLDRGERVYLQGVTFGTNHVQPGTPGWLRPLPAGLRSWLAGFLPGKPGGGWGVRTTAKPTLKVWLEVVPASLTNAATAGYRSVRFVLSSVDGVIAGDRAEVPFSAPLSRFETTVDFSVLPRRSPQIQILCLPGDYYATNVTGRWVVANPALTRTPLWTPDTLPATRRDKDLECTLERVVFGIGRSSSHIAEGNGRQRVEWAASLPGNEASAGLALAFKQEGASSNLWAIAGLTATDAAGNSASASSTSWSDIRNLVLFTWSPSLWPEETWELRISAKRKSDAPFEPAELAVFSVDKPTLGQGQSLSETRTLGGVTISATEFLLKPPLKGDSWSSSDLSCLKVSVAGATPGTYVDLVSATDEHGKAHSSPSWSSNGSNREYHFKDLPETGRLTFSFAVQTGRQFTFRVRPENARTNVLFR